MTAKKKAVSKKTASEAVAKEESPSAILGDVRKILATPEGEDIRSHATKLMDSAFKLPEGAKMEEVRVEEFRIPLEMLQKFKIPGHEDGPCGPNCGGVEVSMENVPNFFGKGMPEFMAEIEKAMKYATEQTKRAIRYCSKCGEKMKMEVVGAETIAKYGRSGTKFYPYDAFDRRTGKRNNAIRYSCRNEGFFSSGHDGYSERMYDRHEDKGDCEEKSVC